MSNDDANNNNTQPSNSPTRSDQEEGVLYGFRSSFQHLHAQLLQQTPDSWTEQEKSFLLKLYQEVHEDPRPYMIAAGVATFVLLKGGRGIRKMIQQRGTGSSPPPKDATPPPEPSRVQKTLEFFNFFDCAMSSIVSLIVGERSMKDMDESRFPALSQIPLLAGPSNLNQAFCGDLMHEFQLQIVDHKEILRNPHDPNLQTYLDFIGNCIKREAVMKKIRKEKGLGPSVPVDIPKPDVLAHYKEEEQGAKDEDMLAKQVNSWILDQAEDFK